MIKGKTYNGQAGLNYIQNADLAFAKIYAVKREGIQYDKYVTGSTNRTYVHQDSLGRINFLNVFASGGEKVFVIYKPISGTEPETPPGVCVPVSYTPSVLETAKVGSSYTRAYLLTGSPPFILNVTEKPDWSYVFLYTIGIFTEKTYVRLEGTPTAEGTEDIEFQVSNCGGSPITVTDSFTVLPAVSNFSVSKVFISKINSVTGIEYLITSGTFPMTGVMTLTGVHGDYTGTISVNISNILFPLSLRLLKNGVELEVKPVPSNNTYVFASQSYLTTDNIQIILD